MKSLEDYLRRFAPRGIALAFSGGVDSALLLHVLSRLQQAASFPLMAFFFSTSLQTEQEEQEGRRMAEREGVPFTVLRADPLRLPELRHNPPERCYLCKRALFSQLREAASSRNMEVLMDGTHADDLHTYRPGLRALKEEGVVSPLAELGWGKKRVRQLAEQLKLSCASKPASPCLATRFEYGAELTPERLRQVAEGEALLQQLYPGVPLRLRVHGELARLELPGELLPRAIDEAEQISAALEALGFRYITLDLRGFRSGSMDSPQLALPHGSSLPAPPESPSPFPSSSSHGRLF